MVKVVYDIKCRNCLNESLNQSVNFNNSVIMSDDLLKPENNIVYLINKKGFKCSVCKSSNQDYYNLNINNVKLEVPFSIEHFILKFKKNGDGSTIKTGGTPHKTNTFFKEVYYKIKETIECIPSENLISKDIGFFEIIISRNRPQSKEKHVVEKLTYYGYNNDELKSLMNTLGQFV